MKKHNWHTLYRKTIAFLFVGLLCLYLLPVARAAEEEPDPTPTLDLKTVYEEGETSVVGDRGERILRVQQRLKDLGYLNYRPTGYYMSMTLEAVKQFQKRNNLVVEQVIGEETMDAIFGNHAVRQVVYVQGGLTPPKENPYQGAAVVAPWMEVEKAIPVGNTVTIIDQRTSLTFSAIRTGGENHMDIEAATGEDGKAFLKIFSGRANTSKRPVMVEIGSRRYTASLYGMPHGQDTIEDNQMNGHACLYFSGSTSNGLGLPDAEHDENLRVK
ncbi:peptidoglycan-binding protein [Eubacteriales bacterium OttesenSCG-928-M02]|nr:peptidoglycan-binding protein [Eubacteriales bacterium OttesenSCG-928-M02]